MIKILTIGILLYFFYRLVFKPNASLNSPTQDHINQSSSEDIVDVDYEDVD